MKNRIQSFDVARTFAILVTYFAHIIAFQAPESPLTIGLLMLSPGATMAILGFISAALIVPPEGVWPATELPKRFIRIYVPMLLCSIVSFALGQIHHIPYDLRQIAFHLLGTSLFMDWFNVPNNATIGYGLWFVTAILIMYFTLPIQVALFRHHNGFYHLVVYNLLCILLREFLPADSSFWTVAVSFALGVYLVVNGKLEIVIKCSVIKIMPLVLLAVVGSYLALRLPNSRWLFGFIIPFYPLVLMPFMGKLADKLPHLINTLVAWFSEISYEFFIIQFALFNGALWRFVGKQSLCEHIATSFILTLFAAWSLNRLGRIIRFSIENYLLQRRRIA